MPSDAPDVFSYIREYDGERLLIVLNFSHEARVFRMDSEALAEIALSTVPGRGGPVDLAQMQLAADEGVIVRLLETS